MAETRQVPLDEIERFPVSRVNFVAVQRTAGDAVILTFGFARNVRDQEDLQLEEAHRIQMPLAGAREMIDGISEAMRDLEEEQDENEQDKEVE